MIINRRIDFMKRQIRRGVFETNSSSTHSITMCSGEEYDKWCSGNLLFWVGKKKFGTKEDIIEELKELTRWDNSLMYPDVNWDDDSVVADIFDSEEIQSSDEFFDDEYLETFEEKYHTPNGEEVVAFGKFGYD
jgi:hypothetical protein